jgi:prepilin-type N-terminal cleavage/methylation domain-containing protein
MRSCIKGSISSLFRRRSSLRRSTASSSRLELEPFIQLLLWKKRSILLSQVGMTLIEILVAMAIMSVLTYYIATTIQSGARNKVKIEKNIRTYSTVRDALKVMEADINRAFNYRDINIQLYNEAMKEREKRLKEAQAKTNEGKTGSDTPPPKPIEPFEAKEEKILTAFFGDEDEVHFTSLNNVRTMAEQKESDQMEVGYFVETCRGRLNKKKRSECLWRRVSPILDDDVKDGGERTVLVENVTEFRLRYLGPTDIGAEAEWDDGWQSDGNLDASTKGQFPMAVEVTLEVEEEGRDDQKKRKTKMTMVAQVRNPNNPKPEEENDGSVDPAATPTNQ